MLESWTSQLSKKGCTEMDVDKFMKLPYKNKLFFTCKQMGKYSGAVHTYLPAP